MVRVGGIQASAGCQGRDEEVTLGVHAPRSKACEVCQQPFIVLRMGQKVCGIVCARKYPKVLKAKNARELRERKRAARKLSAFKADAQRAFNAWIRLRDAELGCVSCGETNPPMLLGGQWDAGHFLSRGAYPELAFEPLNVWRQCKSCNAGSGKFAHKARTVNQKYEEELLRRIGPEKLAWLKGPHEAKKYTREDYEAIEATYKAKRKELEKEHELRD